MLTQAASPLGIVAGDWNGDGLLDLATANDTDDAIGLLFNQGDGGFADGGAISTGANSQPVFLIASDFDGDGHLDLVSGSFNNANLSVELGGGNGVFTPAATVVIAEPPNALAAADWTGDGHPDLMVVWSGLWELQLLPGDGDGGFEYGANWVTRLNTNVVVAGDFNRDGQLDVASAGGNGLGGVDVFFQSAGQFQPAGSYPCGTAPWGLTAADLDGDGLLDLAAVDRGTQVLCVLHGLSDGGFSDAGVMDLVGLPTSIAAADMNHDGIQDLVIATNTGVMVLLGQADGGLVQGAFSGADSNTAPAVVADLNGDGWLDVATTDELNHAVNVAYGICTP